MSLPPADAPHARAESRLPVLEDRMCRPGALDNSLRRWFAPARREVSILAPEPGQTVADLGAGTGYFAPELLARVGPAGRLILVDIDSENLEIARARVSDDPRVRLVVASAARVSAIPSESVDRALLSLVLCCLVEKESAVDETWRILRPGGRALVTYPRWRSPWRRRPSLRVTPERWSTLVARRAWTHLPAPPGRVVRRHLLEKPLGSSSS